MKNLPPLVTNLCGRLFLSHLPKQSATFGLGFYLKPTTSLYFFHDERNIAPVWRRWRLVSIISEHFPVIVTQLQIMQSNTKDFIIFLAEAHNISSGKMIIHYGIYSKGNEIYFIVHSNFFLIKILNDEQFLTSICLNCLMLSNSNWCIKFLTMHYHHALMSNILNKLLLYRLCLCIHASFNVCFCGFEMVMCYWCNMALNTRGHIWCQ